MEEKKQSSGTGFSLFLKVSVIFLICLLLFFAGVVVSWFFKDKLEGKKEVSDSSAVQLAPEVSPSPVATESAEPSVTPTEGKSDLELIREAFAEKYDHLVGDVEVNVSKMSLPYASGGVRFSGQIGGGWFLTYKGDDGWIIVADGNGTIPCEAIEPYDFPTDMAPECFTEDGTIVVR